MAKHTRTIGLWGESGATKTTQVYHLIKRYIQQHRKKVRYIMADNGGAGPILDSGLVDSGWVDIFDITMRHNSAMSTMMNFTNGLWYRTDANGNQIMERSKEFATTDKEWDKIGCYVFEGGQSIAKLVARGIAGSNDKKGFGKPYDYVEQGYNFGGVSMQHIGMIQDHVTDVVIKVKAKLPVDLIIWTFHDGSGQNRNNKVSALGPAIVGSAATTVIGREFNDMLHLCRQQVEIEGGLQQRVMCYFQDHPDQSTGINCLAKIRVLGELYPYLLQRWPLGGLPMSFEHGVSELYDYVDLIRAKARQIGDNWIQQLGTTTPAPLPSADVDLGELKPPQVKTTKPNTLDDFDFNL